MGTSKRKSVKPPPQLRSRTTRSRGKALANPAENTQQLTDQLRALGLYAAPTLGDGNCLFRALSDQLYGTPSHHLKLRKDICDWMAVHKERYEPFVDDERGLAVHLQCMRQQATYGGHLELSAFAHMTQRNVKVVQPGLVYVIEWDAGGDDDADRHPPSPPPVHASTALQTINADESVARLTRRERKRAEREKGTQAPPSTPVAGDDDGPAGPVYVAYHDWEHFSSIRNLRGPHAGLPSVRETPAPEDGSPTTYTSPTRKRGPSTSFSKPPAKMRTKGERRRGSLAPRPLLLASDAPPPVTPSQVPLPMSRSPSPMHESTPPPPPPQDPLPYPLPPSALHPRIYRSPKRTFDESSASSESSQSLAKRVRATALPDAAANSTANYTGNSKLSQDADALDTLDTPPLTRSAPGSPSPSSSMSSLSTLSSRASTPPAPPPPTRRERKRLGLPKPRTAQVGGVRASAGKIVIPGGRFKRSGGGSAAEQANDNEGAGDAEEWMKNGTGRVDVRGFRELRI